MKKVNRNIFVFIFVCIIVASGFFSKSFASGMYDLLKQTLSTIKVYGPLSSFADFTVYSEELTVKSINYHDEFIDINSIFNNIINTKIVKKEDITVVKSEENYLINIANRPAVDSEIDIITDNIKDLSVEAQANNADFLYVFAPVKNSFAKYPENINDFSNSNYERFIKSLKNKNIPYIDLKEKMETEFDNPLENYFVTDHHWKPTTGLWATEKICEELNEKYNFEYQKYYNDLENYNIKTYKDWFLGSSGRKVGTYFTSLGADDFDLITPKFNTSLIEEQPIKNEKRTGAFTDTVLFNENVETKGYYKYNPYAAYSGGDLRLQIITNNLNTDGETILVIRDSFACTVTPFLALNAGKLYVADIRKDNQYVGDKINISEFIKNYKPDKVIVLYSGINTIAGSKERYEFK